MWCRTSRLHGVQQFLHNAVHLFLHIYSLLITPHSWHVGWVYLSHFAPRYCLSIKGEGTFLVGFQEINGVIVGNTRSCSPREVPFGSGCSLNEGVSTGRKSMECCKERDGSAVQGEKSFLITPTQCGEAQKVLGAEPGQRSSLLYPQDPLCQVSPQNTGKQWWPHRENQARAWAHPWAAGQGEGCEIHC